MRWRGALAAIVAIAVGVVAVQALPWPRRDFPPFVMTIETWDDVRVRHADGTHVGGTSVWRLEYRRRDDWRVTLVSDSLSQMEQGYGQECAGGTYRHFDVRGKLSGVTNEPGMCNGVARWIHYGMAWHYPWDREVTGDRVIYTDPGERVAFDLTTGLPLLYEAGRIDGAIGHRTVFRLERWGH